MQCSQEPVTEMEAVWFSEMLLSYYITMQSHNAEDHDLNLQRRENLKLPINLKECL
jgi:hypothetical protein